MKKIALLVALVMIVGIILILLRGREDVWMCKDNKWVAHGKPSYAKPEDPCGVKKAIPKTKEECLKNGGVWKKLGPDPFETCNIKALDRGTICTDNADCEGWCQADMTRDQLKEGMRGKTRKGKGRCSVWRVELGCFGMLRKGVVSVICID